MHTDLDYIVLGGGISGLSTAYFIQKKFPQASCKILDLEGGWIQSQWKDSFLLEWGPHSCRGSSPSLEAMIDDLGLHTEVLKASTQKRYLYHQSSLQEIPSSLWQCFTSPLGRKLLKGLWKDLWTAHKNSPNESIKSFFDRRFGKQASHIFGSSLVAGIYAGDISKLSAAACFPQLVRREKEYGSLIKSYLYERSPSSAPFSFREGMQSLTKALQKRLSPLEGERIHSLTKEASHYLIQSQNHSFRAQRVFCCLPPTDLALICPKLKKNLKGFSTRSLSIAQLAYEGDVLKGQEGFGYLLPQASLDTSLGCIFHSCLFPQHAPEGHSLLTLMLSSAPEKDIIQKAPQILSKHLGLSQKPLFVEARTLSSCLPQYTLTHQKNLKELEKLLQEEFPGLFVLGQHFRGLGIPACVTEAENIIRELSTEKTFVDL